MPDGTGLKMLVGGFVKRAHVVLDVHHGVEMRQVSENLGTLVLHHAVTLLQHVRLEVGRNRPEAV